MRCSLTFIMGGMWAQTASREAGSAITFVQAYVSPPVMLVGLSMRNLDINITASSFELAFRTWFDTRLARFRANWLEIRLIRKFRIMGPLLIPPFYSQS